LKPALRGTNATGGGVQIYSIEILNAMRIWRTTRLTPCKFTPMEFETKNL